MTYQTFSGKGGASDSDSPAKLARLQLPRDLSGQAVLDIACNEGFFCEEAWRRKASRVVGIDKNPEFVKLARQRDTATEYHAMDWTHLLTLDEQFDLILLLSALHYAVDPDLLLRNVMRLLKPEGLFVLECGVASGDSADWITVERPVGDVVRHPTHSMLMGLLTHAAVRRIGPSVDQVGDPIERHVYHVRHLKPIVLLVSGESGSGKSTLLKAMSLGGQIIPINLDSLLVTMPAWCKDEALLEIRRSRNFQSHELRELVDLLVEHGVEEAFVDEVLRSIRVVAKNARPPVTVIEGYALHRGDFRAAFAARLRDHGCYVWLVEPVVAPPSEGEQLLDPRTAARDI
jgi:ubiquinone/menaquinone biosynthesis C-methylase UbiE